MLLSSVRYNVLTSTIDDKQLYKKLTFQYTILDEAHLLKNMTSIRYKNLLKIQVGVYQCMVEGQVGVYQCMVEAQVGVYQCMVEGLLIYCIVSF